MTTPKTWEEVERIIGEAFCRATCRHASYPGGGKLCDDGCKSGSSGGTLNRGRALSLVKELHAAGLAVVPREPTLQMEIAANEAEFAHWAGAIKAALSAGELAPPDKGEG